MAEINKIMKSVKLKHLYLSIFICVFVLSTIAISNVHAAQTISGVERLHEGIAAYEHGKYDDAVFKLKMAVYQIPAEKKDQLWDAHLYLGLSYFLSGEEEDATSEFHKANEIFKNRLPDPDVHSPKIVKLFDGAPYFEDTISFMPITGTESFKNNNLVNIKNHEYTPYYNHIKDKIKLYFLLQYGTDQSINKVTKDYKPIVVTFKVLPSGKIVDVLIVDPVGNRNLATKIQISIRNTTLNKFPGYIDEKHIDINFNFFFKGS